MVETLFKTLFGVFLGYLLGCIIVEIIGEKVSGNLFTAQYEKMMPIFWFILIFTTIVGGLVGFFVLSRL